MTVEYERNCGDELLSWCHGITSSHVEDGRPLSDGQLMSRDGVVDVLIIGAGAAGGVAAMRLAEAGFSVLCLEQGEWPDRTSFLGGTEEWELAGRQLWSSDPSIRKGPADYPVDLSESDVGVLNYNGVGGGTVLYAAQWARLFPSDFIRWTTDGVADDWPVTYSEMAPYYERTDRQFGVSGLGGDPAYPADTDPPFPPLPIGIAGLRVARTHTRLGWHWWPATNAILSAPVGHRHPCVQRGTCVLGCAEGAKASTDLTHWPAVVKAGGRLVTGAGVVRINHDPNGLATGAEWIDNDGHLHFQEAEVVLLGANGMGTPRILLASDSARFPDGMANSSGLVGRRLMVHPLAVVKGLFRDDIEGWRGHAGASIVSFQFYSSDERRGFVGGAKWALSPGGGPLRAALTEGGKWGAEHHRHVRERFGGLRIGAWCVKTFPMRTIESSCLTRSRIAPACPPRGWSIELVTISHALCDWHIERATESLVESGAWNVTVDLRYPANGHFMGTARMGDNPARSVVDRWCMAHDSPNLGIIDGSVFVTSGGVNPTSTIAALALRAADHLIENRGAVPRPARRRSFAVAGPRATNRREAEGPSSVHIKVRSAGVTALVRQRLNLVADLVIPAGQGMPSASQVDIGGELLDRVIALLPDLAGTLTRLLEHDTEDLKVWLGDLSTADPEGYRSVLLAVAASYYLHPQVRQRIGYSGHPSVPVRANEIPEYVTEDLLEQVIANWGNRENRSVTDAARRGVTWTSSERSDEGEEGGNGSKRRTV